MNISPKVWVYLLYGLCTNSLPTLLLVFSASFLLGYTITATTQRPFLSWQTWDLLRIMYYGFRGFCQEFLQKHPGYTIYPIRFNGSAIESFFSQLKYITSGHLSGTNYATARAAVLTRGSVKGKRRNTDYRKVPLHIRKHDITKKHYHRKK